MTTGDSELEEAKWVESLRFDHKLSYQEITGSKAFPMDFFGEWEGFDILRKADFDALHPMPNFEQYVEEKDWEKKLKSIALTRSNPKIISEVNDLAAAFNAKLPTILAKGDEDLLKKYYQMARKIEDKLN